MIFLFECIRPIVLGAMDTPILHLFDLPEELIEAAFGPEYTAPIDRTVLLYVCKRLNKAVRGTALLTHPQLCRETAIRGYVGIYVWANGREVISIKYCANIAVINGQVEFLKHLRHAQHYKPGIKAYLLAAESGSLNVLKWMGPTYLKGGVDICMAAAKFGRLEVLQWLIAKRYRCAYCVCERAANAGQLEIVKWFYYEKKYRFTATMCSDAAAGRQLDVLKWLRSVGCPWDTRTRYQAQQWAAVGYPEVLDWINANGCP